jgi:hypothetical protein
MTFQELQYHLEDNACTIDHIEDIRYTATNCISFRRCEIEDLPEYGVVSISHYCYELGIPAPDGLENDLISYRVLRKYIRDVEEKVKNL